MKTLALAVILLLQSTGTWPHISEHARAHLLDSSIGPDRASLSSSTTKTILPSSLPVKVGKDDLSVDAVSAFAIDTNTSTILYSKNPSEKRPIASVTKLVTALVILSRHNPNQTITIPKLPEYASDAETIGLQAGDTYTVGDIVKAALIPSANDAADSLALFDAGTTPRFAAEMNFKMKEWGITNTRFSSPSGLQDTDNYTTAESLSKIARLAMANSFIKSTVAMSTATITSTNGRTFSLTSTNNLLASGDYYGIKTGYTQAAGECFVGVTRINGHEVITVVLGASDRFGVTQTLNSWIGQNWQWL
jgi:D-alanyl-D-alanine carboxypeptidase